MTKAKRLSMIASVAAATMLASLSADAFFGPMSWMRGGGWGPGWGGWGSPWYGYGYPYYWGGYPYYGGWGYPGWGYPGWGYPLVAPVLTQPASTADK